MKKKEFFPVLNYLNDKEYYNVSNIKKHKNWTSKEIFKTNNKQQKKVYIIF